MYSILLSGGACMLLLSSFTTIVILLKKKIKLWTCTSLYILSISDILFSIFTSTILLVNYMEGSFHISYDKWNNTEDHKGKFINFSESTYTFSNENNFTIIAKCNFMNITTKYGMFFFPFTNSFVSLLIISAQCKLNVSNLRNHCVKFFESQGEHFTKENICKSNNSITEPESYNMGTQEETIRADSECKKSKTQLCSIILMTIYKFLQALKYNKIKKNNKTSVSIFIISQWIIPLLVTGFLYGAKHEEKYIIKDMKNPKCFMQNNFLFDDCYDNIPSMYVAQNVGSETYIIPLPKNYTSSEDLLRYPNLNDTEINEIIFKVQNIVSSTLNETCSSTESNFYDISESLNATEHLELNVKTMITKDKNNIEANSTDDSIIQKLQHLYNITDIKNDTLSLGNIQLKNDTNKYYDEQLLFNHLILNSSESTLNNTDDDITSNSIPEFKINDFDLNISTENEKIPTDIEETTKYNISVKTNDQIYADILKRIHIMTQHDKFMNSNKTGLQYNKKQAKYNKLEHVFQQNFKLQNQSLPSIIETLVHTNDNTSKIISVLMIDRCSISNQFLKLHLFILVFVIYFLPIIFSSILQQHSQLMCRFISEKLQVQNERVINNSNKRLIKEMNDFQFSGLVDLEKASTSKSTFTNVNMKLDKDTKKDLQTLEEIKIYNENYNPESRIQCEDNNHCDTQFDKEQIHITMTKQMENILKLSEIIKMSLFSGTLLWTPIFIGILLKVFLSLHVPKWLLSITYLSGITFGILRNIFNLKMIKLEDTNITSKKANSIHPIE